MSHLKLTIVQLSNLNNIPSSIGGVVGTSCDGLSVVEQRRSVYL